MNAKEQLVEDVAAVKSILDIEDNWCHYGGRREVDGHQQTCLILTMSELVTPNKTRTTEKRFNNYLVALQKILCKKTGSSFIVAFNDNPTTTHADVVEVLGDVLADAKAAL